MSKKTAAGILLSSLVLAPIAAVPAQAAVPPPSAALQTASKTMYVTKDVNVRAGASTKFKIVKKLKKGTKVTVTATKKGWSAEKKANVSWSKISGGWVRSDFLTSKKPAVLNDTSSVVIPEGGGLCGANTTPSTWKCWNHKTESYFVLTDAQFWACKAAGKCDIYVG